MTVCVYSATPPWYHHQATCVLPQGISYAGGKLAGHETVNLILILFKPKLQFTASERLYLKRVVRSSLSAILHYWEAWLDERGRHEWMTYVLVGGAEIFIMTQSLIQNAQAFPFSKLPLPKWSLSEHWCHHGSSFLYTSLYSWPLRGVLVPGAILPRVSMTTTRVHGSYFRLTVC